jgi:uncharacterized protein involved in exopolysaccharide biosynthesis
MSMAASTNEPAATELGAFLRAIWRRRMLAAEGTVAAMVVGAAAFLLLPAQYEATARLAVAQFHMQESPTGDEGRETFAAVQSLRSTYASLVKSPTIAQRIVEQQDFEDELDLNAEELLERVTVTPLPNSALLEISVELPDAELAAAVASAFAEQSEALGRRINVDANQRARALLEQELRAADEELDRLEDIIGRSLPDGGDPPPRMRRVQAEFETALAARSQIARRLKLSVITVASQIGELMVVDEPLVPERPSGPGVVAMVGGAGVLGFMLSLLVAGLIAGMESTEGEDGDDVGG